MKKLALLGSTGSIGTQTLDVVRSLSKQGQPEIKIEVLAAGSNIDRLERQIREFRPKAAAVFQPGPARKLRQRIRDLDVPVLEGMEGLCQAASWDSADLTLNAVVGMIGLQPTLAAVRARKTVALANKETLVAGGSIVMEEAARNGVSILPVDSEHSAIFQCLQGCPEKKALKKLILTASGGPFFGKKKEELRNVTVAETLHHPNWSMGAKVTVDSASMMNKGLEVMEACWLFGMKPEQVEVVVHRQSIVHSLIEYQDHSVIAQLGLPDMRIPIQYALTYPARVPSPVGELKLWETGKLTFEQPDFETFPCLPLCLQSMKRGGLTPAAANGANEKAVELFLAGKIGFPEIPELIEAVLERRWESEQTDLDGILRADREARETAARLAGEKER